MQHLYYQFPGTWFGDCMPFAKETRFTCSTSETPAGPSPSGSPSAGTWR